MIPEPSQWAAFIAAKFDFPCCCISLRVKHDLHYEFQEHDTRTIAHLRESTLYLKPSSFLGGPDTIAGQMSRIVKYLHRGFTWQGRQFDFWNPTHHAHRRGRILRWCPPNEIFDIKHPDFHADSLSMATYGSQHSSTSTDRSNEVITHADDRSNESTTEAHHQRSIHMLRCQRAASLLRAISPSSRTTQEWWPVFSTNSAIRNSLKRKRLRRILITKRARQGANEKFRTKQT